uniref:RING-type domain-containing protein n=1 Tax=Labrus bergylta TaxID=56723 RepID=A0A3Q3GRB8_9LABR
MSSRFCLQLLLCIRLHNREMLNAEDDLNAQFLCSICLDVFTDPVSIPCGHNFCKSCITHHWDVNDQCECPMCKDVFEKRPQLRVNTFISEMAAQFRQIPGLKRHELVDPVENLEDRICKSHGRPLEMFCKTDQRCVCQFCTESEHKQHVFVPMMEENKIKRDKLVKLDAEIQQKILERRLTIEKIRQSVKLSRSLRRWACLWITRRVWSLSMM